LASEAVLAVEVSADVGSTGLAKSSSAALDFIVAVLEQ